MECFSQKYFFISLYPASPGKLTYESLNYHMAYKKSRKNILIVDWAIPNRSACFYIAPSAITLMQASTFASTFIGCLKFVDYFVKGVLSNSTRLKNKDFDMRKSLFH